VGDTKSRETPKEPDRLAKAVVKKVESVTVDDRELSVRKWNLHTSLKLMGTLGDILKDMVSSVGPKMDIASLLQRDIGELLGEHEANIVKVLACSIAPGNFKDLQETQKWIAELGAADALRLFAIIAKQNIRPLVAAVGEIAKEVSVVVKANASGDQKESRQPT